MTYLNETLYPDWDMFGVSELPGTSDKPCGAFGDKVEEHWCKESVFFSGQYRIHVRDGLDGDLCVANSKDECCTLDSAAVAGTVVGCTVGLTGLIVVLAYVCKCCCFRHRRSPIVQQPAAS